jgi:hypothetical protein
MIESILIILVGVIGLLLFLIFILFFKVNELREDHKRLTSYLNDKPSKISFDLERDERRELDNRVDLLYNHFGLIIREQPSKRIDSMGD